MKPEPKPSRRRGLLVILSSPSGAGKTTLAQMLVEQDDSLSLSISMTTRQPRQGEVDGEDYFFVTEQEFAEREKARLLLESARVHGNYYGTPRAWVESELAAGRDVLFDVDWQGARQIAEQMGDDAVRIFLLPPSGEVLAARLRRRAQDTPEVIAQRLKNATWEMEHFGDYDYVIVNEQGELAETYSKLRNIIAVERSKLIRNPCIGDFVRAIRQELGE